MDVAAAITKNNTSQRNFRIFHRAPNVYCFHVAFITHERRPAQTTFSSIPHAKRQEEAAAVVIFKFPELTHCSVIIPYSNFVYGCFSLRSFLAFLAD